MGLSVDEYKQKLDDAIKRMEEKLRDNDYKYLSIANPLHGEEFFSMLFKKDWSDKSMIGITKVKLYILCSAKITIERCKELLQTMILTKANDPKATHFVDYKKLRFYMRQEAYWQGPKNAKKIDLVEPGEESRPTYIANDLSKEEEEILLSLLKKYRDVFAWSYKDLKRVDPEIYQHTIPTRDDAQPSRQQPYTYNETFARKIKEEIEKLKEAESIYEIEHTDWVSPIVVVPKKNGKLRVCVNLNKVNAATIRDNYPLSITKHILERVAGKEAYSFLDGFLGYNQLLIDPKDQHKIAFATEWGIFAYKVMPFGLTNAPATFQRLMSHAFKEYLRNFLEVYMDDVSVCSSIRADPFEHLKKVLM
ncbi:hypothetical protein L7F22_035958 [Adiantum nelumboides]|nr:hypothetical protein [Adiantum nelumboides]